MQIRSSSLQFLSTGWQCCSLKGGQWLQKLQDQPSNGNKNNTTDSDNVKDTSKPKQLLRLGQRWVHRGGTLSFWDRVEGAPSLLEKNK